MQLKQIEIMGFKSFADKVVFTLSDGITAIVGPNGSGKSNVADAVRWVLGEQSARILRGTKMEDVIFSGTTSRKPVSLCEVKLLFDNEDGALPVSASEVEVTRRLYRNGESDYLINGQSMRMRDIHALFYDTGVGREGYSIIGQGRIEEILSSKGEERREALEEAAGVMKYKVRREEARRKLGQVAGDIVRIDDILGELSQSLDPLYEQKQRAEQAKLWQARLKTLDINLFLYHYQRNRARHQALCEETKAFEREEAGLKRALAADEQALETLGQKLQLVEDLLDRAGEKRVALSTALQQAQAKRELLDQRLGFLQQEQARLAEAAAESAATRQGLTARSSDEAPRFERELSSLEHDQAQASAALEELVRAITALEDEIDGQKSVLMQHVDGDAQRKARFARVEALLAQGKEREGEITARLDAARSEKAQIEAEIDVARAQLEGEKAQARAAEQAVAAAAQAQAQAQSAHLEASEAFDAARAEYGRCESAYRHQQQLMRDFEGYQNSVRLLMRDITDNRVDAAGVLGTVAGLIRVPQRFETAMEQALGGSLQNIVVDAQHTAKRLIEHLRTRRYGRVTFLPQASLRARTFSHDERDRLCGEGVHGVAAALIESDPRAKIAVDYLLGRTVIVEDMDAGIALTRRCTFSYRCVTLKGDILQSGGAMTGGSVREFNLVARDRLVKQAKDALDAAKTALDAAAARHEQTQRDAENSRQTHEARREKVVACHANVRMGDERLDATVHALARTDAVCEQLGHEMGRVAAMCADARDEMDKLMCEQPVDERALRDAIDEGTARLSELRRQREARQMALFALREGLAVRRSEQRAFENDRARANKQLADLEKALAQINAQLEANRAAQEAASAERHELIAESERLSALEEENRRALDAVQTQHEAQRAQSASYTAGLAKARAALESLREKKYRADAQLGRVEADFEHLQTRLWEQYELTYAQARGFEEEISIQNATREAQTLRESLRELGPVNIGAIEEYQRVEERHSFLSAQRDDLVRAQEDLDQLINDLTAQMQKRFVAQFDIINEHFGRIFKGLFRGGQARLVLADPSHAMECAIDIVAQPPGKNLQLITLLSGGERSLTAIALLFALLEVNAAPFCILDEIEAALDEENLHLFADFIKTYAKSTQFLIITHRRPTMEAASYMYGIAMEEAGVSKSVSVRFA